MIYYAIGYLIIGALILVAISVVHRMDNSEEAKSMRRIHKIIAPSPKTWHEKLILLIIVPVIAATIAVLFWPVVIVWIINNKLSARTYKNREIKEPDVFKVKNEYLKEQISIEGVEALEMVKDPLGAVPEIPFGHLNSAWKKLKGKIQSKDELWSFSAQWTSEWGYKDLRTGYAIVTEDNVTNFFIASIKNID